MLRLEGFSASYGDVRVLWDVNLRVERGEVVALIGPNGAGKTTLLRALMGLVPWRGKAEYQGRSLAGRLTESLVRDGLCLVPEGGRVFPEMTCRENLLLGARARRGAFGTADSLAMVHGLFPRLAERAGQKASTLSGGERQMLALGRALMAGPELLLLDEPSLGLHPLMAAQVFEAVGRINQSGVTIVLVEQKVDFALEMSGRAYVLEQGRVAMHGPAAEVAADPRVRRAYLAL